MKYELIDQLSDNGYSSSVCFLAEKSGEKFDDGKRTRLVDRAFFAEFGFKLVWNARAHLFGNLKREAI